MTRRWRMAALFASQGYIVVAPNYAGYDTSTLPYHPYLIAAAAVPGHDRCPDRGAHGTAARLRDAHQDNGKLFITGYSQGGYVAMATHRAMQAAGMTVTASAPMSGPYALAAFADAVFYGDVNGGAPISTTLLLTAYQAAYGNIYCRSRRGIRTRIRDPASARCCRRTLTRGQLYADGKLPQYALFSLTPPAPQFAAITPPTTPAGFAAAVRARLWYGNLILNSYRLSYLEDAEANPDGGFPAVTTGCACRGSAAGLAAGPEDAMILRDWVPRCPDAAVRRRS